MSLQRIEDCPFCRIQKEAVFGESEHFLAVYNIAPILPGHSLVIPKRHVESLMDLTESELIEFMIFGRNIAKLLLKAFKTPAFNWTIQEKEEAGQTIAHLHMHIIPRKQGDLPQPGDWYPLLQKSQFEVIDSSSRARLTTEQVQEMVSYIKNFSQI
jgi:bis(5'-adenosyl)-triphosphatase